MNERDERLVRRGVACRARVMAIALLTLAASMSANAAADYGLVVGEPACATDKRSFGNTATWRSNGNVSWEVYTTDQCRIAGRGVCGAARPGACVVSCPARGSCSIVLEQCQTGRAAELRVIPSGGRSNELARKALAPAGVCR